MEGQYFLILCDDKADAIDKAIDALTSYRNSGGAYSASRGTGASYRHDGQPDLGTMTQREREAYLIGKRESMTPAERRMYEMGLRDAYGRNGAENHRDGDHLPLTHNL